MNIFWKEETSTKWHLCIQPVAKLLTLTDMKDNYLMECLSEKIQIKAISSLDAKQQAIVRLVQILKRLDGELKYQYEAGYI